MKVRRIRNHILIVITVVTIIIIITYIRIKTMKMSSPGSVPSPSSDEGLCSAKTTSPPGFGL